ncbi:hypothetical protein SmJEL517_g05270 [Synchytrium microbalum]|uniref:BAR domain-containing protein n=1 Tax=Synchytrium microbalum TaxID=1806994 RepID=A0A507BQ78_9FUNG|nr:uncharacterized protein SmJEL517_g05270 [Synchytrium microbalum]TPX31417.1 hypothetical protein SmJEL517_g05270 [Synchytrium microbalum]
MIDIPLLHVEEAYDDSPAFRKKLNTAESALAALDTNIRRIVGLALQLDQIGKEYSDKNEQLADALQELCTLKEGSSGEAAIASTEVLRMASALKEIEQGRKMAMGQIKDLFLDPLMKFSTTEIAPVKKYGDEYRKAASSYENSHSKFAACLPKAVGLDKVAKEVEEGKFM